MTNIYLTPASISYLNQFLLSVLVAAYLGGRVFVLREQRSDTTVKLLIAFFISVAIFSALLFFEASTLPNVRLIFLCPQNAVLGLSLLFLMQFAYHFPVPLASQSRERRLVLLFMLIYVLSEAGFALWRLWLWSNGDVVYRYQIMDIPPVIGIAWIIFLFVRSSLRNQTLGGWKFAPVFLVPLFLVILNVLVSYITAIPISLYHISMSLGILFSLWYFVQTYLSLQPEMFPFSVKLASGILVTSLAVLGSIAWLVTPIYAETFQPEISDFRTIKFTPSNGDHYQITSIPFLFDTDFGDPVKIGDTYNVQSAKTNFKFTFFGRQYDEVYVSTFGALGIGSEPDFRDYEINFTQSPLIMPILVAVIPDKAPGGVYWRNDGDRLMVTFDHVRGYYQKKDQYTFQVILYSSGEFTITYNGLPDPMHYQINDRPEAVAWAMGIKPEHAPIIQTGFTNFPITSGPEGVIYNYHVAFREHLHRFIFPLALAVFIIGFIFLLGVPIVLNYTFTRPLSFLLQGVEQIDRGQRGVTMPVQFNDEIGYLTQSFNRLSMELNNLINELETRVSNRTSDLLAANQQLLKLSVAIEQSPSTIVITDVNANIEYVNPAFTHSTGYTFDEVKGKNPRILKSGQTSEETYKEMWEYLMAGKPWRGELINKKKDGRVFWEYSVITPILDVNGNLTHYAAIKEDVTARVMAEEALRESEEQYRLLFDLESDAIFIIRNSDGQILEANKAATSLYGYTRGELLSIKNTGLSAEPESTKKATNSPIPSDQVITIPLRYHRKKDGTIFPVDITARFITWEGQSVHIAAIRDITQRKQIEEELVKLSVTDPLTGIANRRYFYIQAEHIFAHKQKPDALAVIMLDIDYFKQVNDRFGHAAGDAVLRQLAERLHQNLRPTDILARYGGEEFAILLPRTSLHEAELVAKRIWMSINKESFFAENEYIPVTISIGVSVLSEDVENLDTLMRYADEALYQAKQAGRNRWVVWKNKTNESV